MHTTYKTVGYLGIQGVFFVTSERFKVVAHLRGAVRRGMIFTICQAGEFSLLCTFG